MITVKTETGSTYQFHAGEVRRVNDDAEKRGDGRWWKLIAKVEPTVGESMMLIMESLSGEGPDDEGNVVDSDVTFRRTSRVISVENDETPQP